MQLVGQAAVDYSVKHGVTMVMVTDIKPGKEAAYRAWADRIQKLQATFPGYVGSFVQPPQQNETGWTTVLRFDSTANLEGWIKSDVRAAMVKESEPLVQGFHAQRVDTSFPGWIPNDPVTGKPPNRWKTAALILLTLFPVVMLELKFLNPHLRELNSGRRHLHRQCDQRSADHLAADAAGHLGLPRLAVSRKSAALAGANHADRARALLPHRDRRALASAVRRARSDGVSTSAKMPSDPAATSVTCSACRAISGLAPTSPLRLIISAK